MVARPRRGRAPRRLLADEMMMSPKPLTSASAPQSPADKAKKPRADKDMEATSGGADDIETMDADDNIEEISNLEEREDAPSSADDADDESIIEDMEKDEVGS